MSSHVLNMAGGGSGSLDYPLVWALNFKFHPDIVDFTCVGSGNGNISFGNADLLPCFITAAVVAETREYLCLGEIDVSDIREFNGVFTAKSATSGSARGVMFLSDVAPGLNPRSWNNSECVSNILNGGTNYARADATSTSYDISVVSLRLNGIWTIDNVTYTYSTSGKHYLYFGIDNNGSGYGEGSYRLGRLLGVNYASA